LYQQIYTYNVIVNGVMDAVGGSHEQKLRLLAEARAARALNYMLLAQFFGKSYNDATAATDLCVPLVLKADVGITSYKRATVKDIYDFVLQELEEACPNLGEYTLERQRMFRFAGYAILGRAYMLVHNYQKATEAFIKADGLMSKSNVTLKLFDYKREMLVWKDTSNIASWKPGFVYPTNTNNTANTEIVLNRQLMNPVASSILGNANVFIKSEYRTLFITGDLRKEFYDSTWTRIARIFHNEGVDLPAYYLNYAECLARTGDLSKARELVSLLRENRFEEGFGAIPATVDNQEKLIKFIVEERLREYMATGTRWFDIRRLWNDPLFQDLKPYTHSDGVNTYTLTENRLTYRIPKSVLVHNPDWIDND